MTTVIAIVRPKPAGSEPRAMNISGMLADSQRDEYEDFQSHRISEAH